MIDTRELIFQDGLPKNGLFKPDPATDTKSSGSLQYLDQKTGLSYKVPNMHYNRPARDNVAAIFYNRRTPGYLYQQERLLGYLDMIESPKTPVEMLPHAQNFMSIVGSGLYVDPESGLYRHTERNLNFPYGYYGTPTFGDKAAALQARLDSSEHAKFRATRGGQEKILTLSAYDISDGIDTALSYMKYREDVVDEYIGAVLEEYLHRIGIYESSSNLGGGWQMAPIKPLSLATRKPGI